MNATELRIGNLILDGDGNECCINTAIIQIIEREKGHLFKPIPLTEEWLKKLGFEIRSEDEGISKYYYISGIPFELSEDGSSKGFDFSYFYDKPYYLCNVQYVHQLQNLYFALTGQDLAIK